MLVFMSNKKTYSVVLNEGVKEALEVAARRDERSMSSLNQKIIIDYLNKEGIPWTKGEPAKAGRPKKSVGAKK